MKQFTYSFILFTFFVPNLLFGETTKQKTLSDYEPILRNAITQFETVFKSSPKKHDLVEQKVNFMMGQAIKGEITFLIDMNANQDLSAMGFVDFYNENKKPAIVIGTYFLDLFDKNPSIFYSALVHEFTHAYDFFNSQRYFLFYKNNRIVKALFEADAYAIESLFIQNYLVTQKIKLTKFESFLIDDFEKTGMSKIILINQIASLPLLHSFLEIRDSKDSIETKVNSLNQIGQNLIAKYDSIPSLKEQEIKMEILAFYFTYRVLLDQLVYDIEQKESEEIINPETFTLEKYPNLLQTQKEITQKIKIYEKEFEDYIIKENQRIRTEI
ncbi:hypothetical protein EHQ92_05615 [Leptospira biflexa]|uniref:hypothetical protein n=1 Tax=Leptospira biflexa TaxID=172 RepID=UPI001090C0AF|nr:hypothetical protein [Leptospira biflexa]TGM47396.1 hypothetical protein EHQ92_05615 [Leptospira biflexa]TGM50138.1 hypothetical protein EHQ88_07470 [Leptospira biflexa]